MGHSCRAHSSFETSSKSHAARLQDERFVRDFLQKSHVKSQKRAFRTRLPPKVTRQGSKTSVSYETSSKSHMSSPQNERFVRDFLKNSHANHNVTATFTSTTTHNLPIPCANHESFRVHTSDARKVLCLPRNVTSVTPRNLTIPCACH